MRADAPKSRDIAARFIRMRLQRTGPKRGCEGRRGCSTWHAEDLVEVRMLDRRGSGAELRSCSVEPPRSCLFSFDGAVVLVPPPSTEDATMA